MQNNFRTIKNKTKNFTIIDNTILQDKNLSLKARGLLCFMLHLPETWIFTEKGLATVTGEGLKSIKSGLKELEDNKYLDEELIGLNVIYEDNNKGTIVDIERYDKTVLFNIKNNDKEYLIPYNDNLIDKIDINNKKIYIKDIKGLFNN